MKRILLLASIAMGSALAMSAQSAELVVVSSAAVRDAIQLFPAKFQAATGHTVRFVFGTAGKTQERIAAGETADLVVIPPSRLAELAVAGKLGQGKADLGISRLGMAVKAGAPHPSIATVDAFRATLLDSPSIAFANAATGATTGVYFAKLMKDMGLAEKLQSRIKLYPDGYGAIEAVASGETVIGAAPVSEIDGVKGVELIGALPEEIQQKTTYSAAVTANAANPEAARALIAMMSSDEGRALFKAHGFDHP